MSQGGYTGLTSASITNLTNKTLEDATVKIGDDGDTTKDLFFSLGGATTNKTMTIVSSQTDDRSLTLPDATDTLVGKATTDTLTNKTIVTSASEKTDDYTILDTDAGKDIILGRATGAAKTFTLPTLSANLGKEITVKNLSAYTLTVIGETVQSTDVDDPGAAATTTSFALTTIGSVAIGNVIVMTSGALSGEARRITDVTGSTITVGDAFSAAPADADTCVVYEAIDGEYRKQLGQYESIKVRGGDITNDEWILI